MVINSADAGLRPLRGAWIRRRLLAGFGDESLGGLLTLTSQRIRFVTHSANRVEASLDIPLRELSSVTDVSAGVARMIRLQWGGSSAVIVVWGIRRLIDAIETARSSPEALASGPSGNQ